MDSGKFEVIYLTGAPASGKSTSTACLGEVVRPLAVFDYGERLREHITGRSGASISYDELRRDSAQIITTRHVDELDEILISWVQETRLRSHIIIDTHAVTRETFGFRVTPFSSERIRRLRPTRIAVLYAPPSVTIARIGAGTAGRLPVTEFEAGFHCALQGAVAINYGIEIGVPIYFLDSSGSE